MSDKPKPKPGSLRDRIAAFESSATSTSTNTTPSSAVSSNPRPKPGTVSWKPRPPSPVDSPHSGSDDRGKPNSGMSVSDARDSIGKAGSLRDRMAALQGRGAFAAPPPAVVPKPPSDRPKWRPPPPPITTPSEDEVGQHHVGSASPSASWTGPAVVPPQTITATVDHVTPLSQSGLPENENEEEEERQRRAAIAARMARIGGARVGMAPPGFERKKSVPKPELSVEDVISKHKEASTADIDPVVINKSPSPSLHTPSNDEPQFEDNITSARKNSEPASFHSVNSSSVPARTPPAMPVPSVPRRAAPPRKKTPKSFSLTPEEAPAREQPGSPVLAGEPVKVELVEKNSDSANIVDASVQPAQEEPVETSVSHMGIVQVPAGSGQEVNSANMTYPSAGNESASAPPHETVRDSAASHTPAQIEHHEDQVQGEEVGEQATYTDEPATAPPEDYTDAQSEEEEAARRVRVAERLAKMGAFNPFAPPPRRQSSGISSEEPGVVVMKSITDVPASLGQRGVEEVDVARSLPLIGHGAKTGEEEEEEFGVPDEIDMTAEGEEQEEARDAEQLTEHALAATMPSEPADDAYESDEQGETAEQEMEMGDTVSDDRVAGNSASEYEDDEGDDLGDEPEEGLDDEVESTSVLQAEKDHYQNDYEEDDQTPPRSIPIIPIPAPILNIPPPPPRMDLHRPIAPPTRPPPPPHLEGNPSGELARLSSPLMRFVPPPPPPPLLPYEGRHRQRETGYTAPPTRAVPPPPPPPPPPLQTSIEEEMNVPEELVYAPLPVPTRFVPPPPPPPLLPPQLIGEHEETEDALFQQENESEQGEEEQAADVEPTSIHPVEQVLDVKDQKPADEKILSMPPPIPRREGSGPSQPPRSQAVEAHGIDSKIPVTPPLPVPPIVPRRPLQAPTRAPPVPSQANLSIVTSVAVDETSEGSPHYQLHQQEVLDESEGDPIDPSFHSPSQRVSAIISTSPASSPPSTQPQQESTYAAARRVVPTEEEENDTAVENKAIGRPKTIAERMAKLGGIKFGAPMPVGVARSPQSPHAEEVAMGELTVSDEGVEREAVEEEQEEDEQARKQRIAARMAGLGGMRLGMMPFGMGGAGVARPRREGSGDTEPGMPTNSRPVPPPRLVPPPPPPPHPPVAVTVQDVDSEQESMATSDEGVKVEAEDSEMEEVEYEDAEEEEDEDEDEPVLLPPPIPSRAGRPTSVFTSPNPNEEVSAKRVSQAPSVPGGRPPVPVLPPIRRPSASATTTTTRKVSGESAYGQQGMAGRIPASYVMVDEPDALGSEELSSPLPLPPPPRPTSRVAPPARAAPPPPVPAESAEVPDSPGSQWEIPSIPSSSLDFGGNPDDLSMSVWSELSQSGTFNAPPSSTKRDSMSTIQGPNQGGAGVQKMSTTTATGDVTMTAEELMATWGRVGVQMAEAATTLFEQSKRSLVGDGTYQGFVKAVANQVPNAITPAPPVYGYVIYAQSGTTVQKRASEIMPGDVVLLSDAKFKGHKGLQTYSQTVGVGEPVVGVISEFEVKKSKVRVFEANQRVGQQTVESVSYRLEDLKSGTVKVFRVLDAGD